MIAFWFLATGLGYGAKRGDSLKYWRRHQTTMTKGNISEVIRRKLFLWKKMRNNQQKYTRSKKLRGGNHCCFHMSY